MSHSPNDEAPERVSPGDTQPDGRPLSAARASRPPVPSPPQQAPYVRESRFRRGAGRPATGTDTAGSGAPYAPSDQNAGPYGPASGPESNAYAPAPESYASGSTARPAARPGRRGPHLPAVLDPTARPRHGCLASLLWLVMLVVAGFLFLRLLPVGRSTGRLVPELVSFVPLMLAPTLACLVLSALWRRRVLLVASALALALNGFWHAGFLLPGARVSAAAANAVRTGAAADDNVARVMTVNTLNGQASAKEIVQVCREQHVEVLCLQELTDGMVADLENAGIDEVLPYHVVSAGASEVSNGGRNGIWTLAPMANVSRNLLPIETSSMPAASITVGTRTVRVVSAHPNSPTRGAQDLWDKGLATISQLGGYDHAYLIMGDFNFTWDHERFRQLLGTSFADASESAGEGFHMTFPSNSVVPSLIEIDHILYARDAGITVSGLETVEIAGTDHKALLGTLEVS